MGHCMSTLDDVFVAQPTNQVVLSGCYIAAHDCPSLCGRRFGSDDRVLYF